MLCFVSIFLQKQSCKAWLKIILPKQNSMQKFRRHRGICQSVNSQERKCKVDRYKLQRQILIINYNYLHPNVRSSHPELFCEKGVLKSFAKLSGKHLCQSFLIKLQTSGNFIKKAPLAKVFSYEFCEIFMNTFFIEHIRWLLFEYVFIWIIFCQVLIIF